MEITLERYKELLKEAAVPIFAEPWFLLEACGIMVNNLKFFHFKFDGKNYVWPFYMKSKYIFNYSPMPFLCKWLGPFEVRSSPTKENNSLKNFLSKINHIDQNLWYHSPIISSGFTTNPRYSYELDLSRSEAELYKKVDSDYRNNKIPKTKDFELLINDSSEALIALQWNSYARSNFKSPFSKTYLSEHIDAIIRSERGTIISLKEKGETLASTLLIWDDNRAYYHLAGMNEKGRKEGASIRLIWESIVYAKQVLKKDHFDFEGSMIKGLERVRKNFGAEKKSYVAISKSNSSLFSLIKKYR